MMTFLADLARICEKFISSRCLHVAVLIVCGDNMVQIVVVWRSLFLTLGEILNAILYVHAHTVLMVSCFTDDFFIH